MNVNNAESSEWNTRYPWTLWFHSVSDNNWDIDSYNKLFTINNLCDYEILKDCIKKIHLQNCMLFLMKDNILPIWEDPENINGSSLSFKILGKDVVKSWTDIILYTITEDINLNENHNINGLSISPKKEFNIIKIWTKDSVNKYSDLYKEYGKIFSDKNVIIKSHK